MGAIAWSILGTYLKAKTLIPLRAFAGFAWVQLFRAYLEHT
jgi:hypothetical protein